MKVKFITILAIKIMADFIIITKENLFDKWKTFNVINIVTAIS